MIKFKDILEEIKIEPQIIRPFLLKIDSNMYQKDTAGDVGAWLILKKQYNGRDINIRKFTFYNSIKEQIHFFIYENMEHYLMSILKKYKIPYKELGDMIELSSKYVEITND